MYLFICSATDSESVIKYYYYYYYKQVKFQSKSLCFQFERGQNFSFDWPASVSNILTVRKWAGPKIVGRNFTSRISPMSTSHDITFDCKILPRHADNVSDHLPIRLQTSVLCNRSQSVEHTVNTQCPQVTHPWGNHGYTNTYRNTLETQLIEIQKLSCNRVTDEITAHDAIDAYMDKLKANILATSNYAHQLHYIPLHHFTI